MALPNLFYSLTPKVKLHQPSMTVVLGVGFGGQLELDSG